MGNELKCCPFCGGEAEIFQFDYFWGVCCKDERCIGHDFEAYYDNADYATAAWNRRYEPRQGIEFDYEEED